MQADTKLPPEQRRGYTNAINALTRMAREEGVKGFFSGASPTIIRGLSINVTYCFLNLPHFKMILITF